MRFAITCSDRYLGVFEAFLKAGWTPVKLFTVPLDNRYDHNQAAIARAGSLNIPVQISPITPADLADLAGRCDALVVASYNWRIGDCTPHLAHAVNFHPSPLPIGRGPYPAVKAILDGATQWGVSCHKLEREFDSGAILAQDRFPLAADECHESLDIKIQLAMNRLAHRVAANLPALWQAAAPQCGGSYWPRWTEAERSIDFGLPVEHISRHLRAFGLIESLARVNDTVLHVRRAVAWTESHGNRPGAVVHINNRTLVVAARDGYVALIEWSLMNREAFFDLGRSAPQPALPRALALEA
jgi:methionyl-tRNA formyltransferase